MPKNCSRFTVEPAPYGLCHFPRYEEKYFRMLTAEHAVSKTSRNGFMTLEWVKTRPRNEALDCRVYAMAAALAQGIDRFTEASWAARERLAGVAVTIPPAPAPVSAAPAVVHPPAVPANRSPRAPAVRKSRWMGEG